MSLALTNWISGNLSVVITSADFPEGYQLRTVQAFDPQMDPRIDQIDTVTQHRVGYLDRPSIISITLGLIASQDDHANNDSIKDFEVLTKLHHSLINPNSTSPVEGFFTMTVSDPVNFTGKFEFYSCVVTSSNPANVVIDDVPASTWNLLALDGEYIRGSVTGGSSVTGGDGGPRVLTQ